MRILYLVAALFAIAATACGDDDSSPTTDASDTTAEPDIAADEPVESESADDESTAGGEATAEADPDEDRPPGDTGEEADGEKAGEADEAAAKLATAEAFLDAFYSFDPDALIASMRDEADTAFIAYYQGWAEAANYEVLTRSCEVAGAGVKCDVTVRDDFAQTLDIGFDVTDSFTLTYRDELISTLWATSDDPPVIGAMFTWIQVNRSELFDGPCDDMFDGGPTPGDCARAVLVAAEEFLLTDEYLTAIG